MTKVTLRSKEISKNREALYLDFYPPIPNPETGKPTRREFLKLHIYQKPKTAIETTPFIHNCRFSVFCQKAAIQHQSN